MMAMGAMVAAALAVAVRADEGFSNFFDLTAIDIRCARSCLGSLATSALFDSALTETRVSGGGLLGICSLARSRTGIGVCFSFALAWASGASRTRLSSACSAQYPRDHRWWCLLEFRSVLFREC